jgi:hypothetical protein
MNASCLAITDLTIIHPDRLRLALNYSTFLHNTAEETDQACYVAKRAMDNAQAEVDSLETDAHPDSIRLIELLRKRIVSRSDALAYMTFLTAVTRTNGSRLVKLIPALTTNDVHVDLLLFCENARRWGEL